MVLRSPHRNIVNCRVVRLRKFSEQEDIQKEAMVPSKEAKLFTYKLLEEHFLQVLWTFHSALFSFRHSLSQ